MHAVDVLRHGDGLCGMCVQLLPLAGSGSCLLSLSVSAMLMLLMLAVNTTTTHKAVHAMVS